MDIQSIRLIYFSPTETTKKIIEGISLGIQADKVEPLDLTPASMKTQPIGEMHDDFVIIGAPVYGGRIALEAVNRLNLLKAGKTPAAIVVLYGNRAYEDALLELKHITEAAGFAPVAAGAFIGEHSFSTDAMPIAFQRPDEADLEKAKAFGKRIRERLSEIDPIKEIPPLKVPGNHPYKERKARPRMSPATEESRCILCGTCAEVCPTGVIRVNDTVTTDSDGCISCCACIKNCPTRARVFDAAPFKEASERLYKTCRDRKEPEIYIH
ncbi:MAG: 4Fe-4S dicluster domain-containing protein [Desulfobacteraceae bacterium]|nr:MAG: 4Fe-4S dicluster domain-containing protein [Desulfobacteraceae bacterium]